ncbi:hypothetical protein OEZ86_011609 [Tetradesmus obliquus]|nr:hypothetical protein OEZ86_011609 [Tetradesmus obliquus]
MEVSNYLTGPISEIQRRDLEQRLIENFYALLFHREGYRPSNVPQEVVEEIAFVVEAKAFTHVMRAAELGMSSRQMLQTYAREASTLLLAEVERYCIPLEATSSSGQPSSGSGVDPQQLSLNEISGGLRSIQTAPSQQQRPARGRDAAWGWLVPGSRMLPYVVLKGSGVAIGRGKEALWAVGGSAGTPHSALANGCDRNLTEVLKRNLGFVEVADGRVSRLHCIISLGNAADGSQQAMLEDCSSNGTFLNHTKLAKGESVPLVDGDRISLVLSVAPLVEQFFTYKSGDPRDPDLAGSEEQSWVGSTHSTAGVFSPGAVHSSSPPHAAASIFRTATSRYTTAEQSTLEDLKCQICLTTLRQCVALEPCGHNFCACCLSHHLGNQLQSGLQLSCPFRCPPPERIIINYAVRALIDLLSSSGRPLASTRSRLGQPAGNSRTPSDATRALDMSAADSMESDYFTQSMSLLCPLDDEHLPMEAANLKSRQVEVALSQLKVASLGPEGHLVCLEALARLAWSDDGVRELIAHSGGVRSLVDAMALHGGSDSIQCHGCLALMSLVRGEGEVCQSNQWHIAKAGAIEVIAQAMQTFRHSAMVQLSVLLCLIPLALENAMMQAHITQECLGHIIAALDSHPGEVDIQTKGLVLLGVLVQGDDAVHDAIRIRELEASVPRRVVAALRQHGTSNDDVLWAALFVLAVLVRDNSCVFERAKGALAWAGVLRVLQSTVNQYKQRHELENVEPDEMIAVPVAAPPSSAGVQAQA